MDVIAMHAAGFENAVATLGTAITSEHARLLTRYTKRVVINYDSDEAGQKAADKAMRLLDEVGIEVRVLKLTGAKDADEYIRLYGADAFRKILEQGSTAFDFKLEKALAKYDLNQVEDKIKAARDLSAIIAEYIGSVQRELYVIKAAERLGISKDVLANDVNRLRNKRQFDAKQKESRDLLLTARNFGDRVNPDAAKNPAVAAAEEVVLGLLLLYPEHRRAVCEGKVVLPQDAFFTALGKRAYTAVCEMEQSEDGFSFSALGEQFTPDEMGRLVRIQQERQALSNNSLEVLQAAADLLIREYHKRTERESGDFQSELQRRRAALQKKKEN